MEFSFHLLILLPLIPFILSDRYAREELGISDRLRFTSGVHRFYNCTVTSSGYLSSNLKTGIFIHNYKPLLQFYINDTSTYEVTTERVEDFYFAYIKAKKKVDKSNNRIRLTAKNKIDGVFIDETLLKVQTVANLSAPVFLNSSNTIIDIKDNLFVGSVLGKLVVDEDIRQVIFAMSAKFVSLVSEFSITVDGRILLSKIVSAKSKNFYEFKVDAYSVNSQFSASVLVKINVLQGSKHVDPYQNLLPVKPGKPQPTFEPQFQLKKKFDFSFNELAPTSTMIGSIKDKKRDLTYFFIGNTHSNIFVLNKINGFISIKDSSKIDYENKYFYKLSAVGKYKNIIVFNATINLHVQDANDNSPQFTKKDLHVRIDEDLSIGSIVTKLHASDRDSGDNGKISFVLANKDKLPFYIDGDTIKVQQKIDLIAMGHIIVLHVKAIDWGTQLRRESETTVTIEIKPVNTHRPVIKQTQCNITLSYNTLSTDIIKFDAVDEDVYDKLVFRLQTKSTLYTLNATTGTLKIADVNKVQEHRSKVVIRLVAYDGMHSSDESMVVIDVKAESSIKCMVSNEYDRVRTLLQKKKTEIVATREPTKSCQPYGLIKFSKQTLKQTSIILPEDASLNTILGHYQAVNSNIHCYGLIMYTIVSGNNGQFQIDLFNGTLYVYNQLNREVKYFYNLKIKATNIYSQSAILNVHVTILDVNDNAPVFTNSGYYKFENLLDVKGTIKVSATDPDLGSNGEVKYSLMNPSKIISIDEKSGILHLLTSTDKLWYPEYLFEIKASDKSQDNQLCGYAIVHLVLNGKTKGHPLCLADKQQIEVPINSPVGVIVGRVFGYNTGFGNLENVTYSILQNSKLTYFHDYFQLDSVTGLIMLKKVLSQKDKGFVFSMQVKVHIGSSFILCHVYKIIVDTYGTTQPKFTDSELKIISLSEEVDKGALVAKLFATLTGTKATDQIKYELVDGSGIGMFSVAKSFGNIYVANNEFTKPFYWLTVQAYVRQNIYTNTHVLIKIKSSKERKPFFSPSVYHIALDYSEEKYRHVVQLFASDGKQGFISDGLKYSIYAGNDNKYFKIDNTGDIYSQQKINVGLYKLNVTVSSKLNSTLISHGYVQINVYNKNLKPPQFTESMIIVNVFETKGSLHPPFLFQSLALDENKLKDNKLRYEIFSSSKFTIDSKTAVVKTNQDFSAGGFEYFNVQARNSANQTASIGYSVQFVTRPLAPTKLSFKKTNYLLKMKENVINVPVVVLTQEVIKNSSGPVFFYIISGNEWLNFAILPGSSTLTVTKPLDYEWKSIHSLKVLAFDGLVFATTEINIHVENIKDNLLTVSQPCFEARIYENTKSEESLITVKVTDPDGMDEGFSYILINDVEKNSPFAVSKNGIISVKPGITFDREEQEEHIMTVVAGSEKENATYCVKIVIEDMNDHAPNFTEALYTVSVLDSTSVGSSIMAVYATDKDSGLNADLSYSLSDVSDHFGINSRSGVLYVKNNLTNLLENKFVLNVAVKDNGKPSFSSYTKVKINVVADLQSLQFKQPYYHVYVSENVRVGSLVSQKININVSLVNYEIQSLDDSCYIDFWIDPFTGTILTTSVFDAEKIRNCSFMVHGILHGEIISSTEVFVTIVDMNDNKPVFLDISYNGTIKEGQKSYSKIMTINNEALVVRATDVDVGDNGLVKYSFVEETVGIYFHINEDTGEILSNIVLDYERHPHSFNFHVKASDQGFPANSKIVPVAVHLTNINDKMPEFHRIDTMSILRPVYNGTIVATVIAKDSDMLSKSQLVYSLESDAFDIQPLTGVVFVKEPSYLKNREVITAQVSVSDGLFSNRDVMRFQLSTYQHNPNFCFVYGTTLASIPENTKVETTVKAVNPVGYSAGEALQFQILNPNGLFTIGKKSGVLKTKPGAIFDRETKEYFLIYVEVCKALHPSIVARTTVNVTITDKNDNPPVFSRSKYYKAVDVDTLKGTKLISVVATDADMGENGRIRYEIASGNQEYFECNAETGAIFLKKKFLKSHNPKYYLTIRASDNGSLVLTSVCTVELQIINEDQPMFTNNYNALVSEDAQPAEHVIQIEAKGHNQQQVYYQIVGGDEYKVFNLGFTSGNLSVSGQLNYTRDASYRLAVKAIDSLTGSWSKAECDITVVDTNDNTPMFVQTAYFATILEDSIIGHLVLQVKAVDADVGSNAKVTYSLSAQSDKSLEKFSIDATSGKITLTSMLDAEREASHLLYITATDEGVPAKSSFTTVSIYVADVNDNHPVFLQSKYKFFVDVYSAEEKQFVGVVRGLDADVSSELTYQLAAPSSVVGIESKSGVMYLREKPTPESVIKLKVSVSDSKYAAFASVEIRVSAMNDNKPVFCKKEYAFVDETGSRKKQKIFSLSAADKDKGKFGKITYQIDSLNAGKYFSVDENGYVFTNGLTFDREQRGRYVLPIRATDEGGRFSLCELIVKVKDENDNVPVFEYPFYEGNVLTSQISADSLLHVVAHDADEGSNAELTYMPHGLGEETTTPIVVDERTGLVSLAGSPKGAMYQFSVRASDNGYPVQQSKHTNVKIVVKRWNDKLLAFTNDSYHVSINEQDETKKSFIAVQANFKDFNGTVRYGLVDGNLPFTKASEYFKINANSGKIKLRKQLDYEKIKMHKLMVRATTDTENHRATCFVYVRVNNVRNQKPWFESSRYEIRIAENTPVRKRILQVLARDSGADTKSDIKYTITSSGTSMFALNKDSGWLKINQPLDREVKAFYELKVKATNSNGESADATVRVHLVDVNDSPPKFSSPSYIFEVKEDALIGQPIGSVSTTDPDVKPTIQYFILSDTSNVSFSINVKTGQINILRKLLLSHYKFTIVAYDGVHTTNAVVSVKTVDVNNNSPFCENSYYKINVRENQNVSTPLLRIKASDADPSDSLKYLIQGDGVGKFQVNKTTGLLNAVESLDRETNDRHDFKVVVADKAGHICTSDVFISVLDENDNAPIFEQQSYSTTVREKSTQSMVLTQVLASDRDSLHNRQLKYTMQNNKDDIFSVGAYGIVSLSKPELINQKNQAKHSLVVKATDLGQPSLSAVTNLEIVVLTSTDTPPQFEELGYLFVIKENSPALTNVGTIAVKVADGLKDKTVMMKLLNDHGGMFTLKNNVLQLQKPLDYEKKIKYSFSVKAWFKQIPSLSSLVNVEVAVTDANDFTPVFLEKSYFKPIDENVRPGTFVLQAFATDADGSKENSRVIYSLMSKHVVPFAIDAETGVLVVNGSIDHEIRNSYDFYVTAEDNGTPKLSSKVRVTINITDLNDNAPVISDYNTSLIIHEGKLPGSTLLKLSVTDRDSAANAAPFYCMLLHGDGSTFEVSTENGINCVIKSKKLFNIKEKSEYDLLIRVTDSGTPKRYSESKVKVFVVEESYYAPVIQDPKIFFVIVSKPYGVTKIGDIRVFDKDRNDIHQYKITAGNTENYFSVQQMTGVIEGKPERGSYSLSIEVSDGKYSDSSLFKIVVHELVQEVYVKSLQVSLTNIDARTFIKNKMIQFVEAMAAISGRNIENVFIWSIQNMEAKSARIKRSSTAKTLLAVAVQNPSDLSYMDPKELKDYMINSKARFDDIAINIYVSEAECSTKTCPTSQTCAVTLTPKEEIISLYTPSGYMTFKRDEKCYCSDWSEAIGTECFSKDLCLPNPCKVWEKCTQSGSSFRCECLDFEKCTTPASSSVTLNGASYVSYGLRRDFDELFSSLSMSFRTESKTNILFYAYGRDFFIVEIELGYLQARFDFGSGVGSIGITEKEVSDGNWHVVRVERSGNYVALALDQNMYMASGRAPGNSAKININGNSVVFGAGVSKDGTPFSGFKGCMKELKLNKKLLAFSGSNDIAETIETRNVKYGCKDSGLCSLGNCPTFSDCINTFTSYKCVCLPGHFGSTCKSKLTCADRPCKNNGICTYEEVDGEVSYKCTCKQGFTGAQCHIDLQSCSSKPCLNNGRCIVVNPNTYKCDCKSGFSGENCDINNNPCSPNPCYNGGKCIKMYNNYKCDCPPGKKGLRCSAGDYCSHVKCENNGKCYELRDGSRCICKKGFGGSNCEQDNNECLRPDTCKNGGTCINTWGSHYCNCTAGSSDADCANAVHKDKEELPLIFIIVGVAGVLILIIIIAIMICCCKKRKRSYATPREEAPERKYPLNRYQREDYELAELFPPNPPPRGFPAPPAYYEDNDTDQASAAMYDPSVTFSGTSSPNDGMIKMKFNLARRSVEYNSDDDEEEDMRYHWDYSEVPEDVINSKMSREGSRIGLTKADHYYPEGEYEYVDIPQIPERPASRRSSLPGFSECENDMPELPALPQQVRLSRQSLKYGNQSPSTLPRLPPDLSSREFNNRYSLLSDENEPNTSYFHDMLEGETVSDITNVTRPYKKPYAGNGYEDDASDFDDQLDGLTETSFNSDDDCATEADPLDPENTRQLERDIKKLIKDLQKRTEEEDE